MGKYLDQGSFLKSLRFLIRPFVRLCVRNSVKLQDLIEVLKGAFVDVALEELNAAKHEKSISKISVMTGVHRRDTTKILKGEITEGSSISLLGKIIGQWRESKRFQDKLGRPRVLSVEGSESEFVDLVRSISSDLNPYTVLFEFERVGAIKRVTGGISLASEMYSPGRNILGAIEILTHDCADLFAAVEENVSATDPIPNLHIRTEYDNIPAKNARDIKLWILGEGAKFHEKVQKHLAQFDRDVNPKRSKDHDESCRIAVSSVGIIS